MTFIAPDEERYAPDLVRALKESSAPIPQDLQVGWHWIVCFLQSCVCVCKGRSMCAIWCGP